LTGRIARLARLDELGGAEEHLEAWRERVTPWESYRIELDRERPMRAAGPGE
jgi:hypothetical protein